MDALGLYPFLWIIVHYLRVTVCRLKSYSNVHKILSIQGILKELCEQLDDGVSIIALAGTCRGIRISLIGLFGEIRDKTCGTYMVIPNIGPGIAHVIGGYGRMIAYGKKELVGLKEGADGAYMKHGITIKNEGSHKRRVTYYHNRMKDTTICVSDRPWFDCYTMIFIGVFLYFIGVITAFVSVLYKK